jgi:hypothetical protein
MQPSDHVIIVSSSTQELCGSVIETPGTISSGEIHTPELVDSTGTEITTVIHRGVEKRRAITESPDINGSQDFWAPSSSLHFLHFLPRSVMEKIVMGLNFDDVFALSLVCKRLQYLITDETMCCRVLQVFLLRSICNLRRHQKLTIYQNTLSHSKEAMKSFKSGFGYASALRRAAKRRQALNTASPFACAILGFADSYIYCCGILCYTLDDKMRILDLHRSGKDESVVSIPGLLHYSIPEACNSSEGAFKILYSNNDIVCCLFETSNPHPRAWVIAFDIKRRKIFGD